MIEVKNLSRKFGTLVAVNDISFSIKTGTIVGFLGPNAAGKTTTLRMLVGYLQPTSGEIFINGKSIFSHPLEASAHIGYLPETNALYDELNVFEYLQFMGRLRKMTKAHFQSRADFVINRCGLKDVITQTVGTLSKGFRQRTGLAGSILHDPPILILDEPTSGLDPNQIFDIRELILDLGTSKTVLISSHIMQEIQAVSEQIMIINKGNIITNESKEKLMTELDQKKHLVIRVEADTHNIHALPDRIPGLKINKLTVSDGVADLELSAPSEMDINREFALYAKEHNWLVLSQFLKKFSLEEVFYHLTRQNITQYADEATENLIQFDDFPSEVTVEDESALISEATTDGEKE